MMGTLIQDLRYGARMILKSPGSTLIAVVTLALGIGANTAIFSLVSAVLVKPLNYQEPERLVMVWESDQEIGLGQDTPAPGNYADWKTQNQVFEDIAALDLRPVNLTGDGEPERLMSFGVSANFFPLLGASPLMGRNFLPEEDRPGANKVVII